MRSTQYINTSVITTFYELHLLKTGLIRCNMILHYPISKLVKIYFNKFHYFLLENYLRRTYI